MCLATVFVFLSMGLGTLVAAKKVAPDSWKTAEDLLASGKPQDALDIYSKLVGEKPDDPRGYVGQGRALWRLNDFDRAITAFDKAIALDPKDSSAFESRGLVFESKGQPVRALQDLDRAVELDPKSAAHYYTRAEIRTGLNDFEKAIADYDQAIALNPRYGEAYAKRGNLTWQRNFPRKLNPALSSSTGLADRPFRGRRVPPAKGAPTDHEKAMADFAKAIELNPKWPLAYAYRAAACLFQRQYDKALADSSRAIELSPQDAKLFRVRSEARRALGDVKGAEEDSQKALALESKSSPPNNTR